MDDYFHLCDPRAGDWCLTDACPGQAAHATGADIQALAHRLRFIWNFTDGVPAPLKITFA